MNLSSLSRRAAVSLAFSAIALPAAAQPSFNISLGRVFNSFSEESAAESRQSTAARVDLEHRAAGERLRLFYGLDAGSFTTPGDWNYYLHSAGATWRMGGEAAGKSSSPAVFIGGSVSWRSNGSSWTAAGYRAAAVFANFERHASPTSTLRAGYRFELRDFPDLPQLDQREHGAFVSFLASFPSRTTLVAEAHVGAKDYRGGQVLVDTPVETDVFVPTPHGGWGRGGMGPGLRWTAARFERASGSLSGQLTLLGRLAQSLADRTGVTLQYTRRSSFGGLPSALVTTPATFFEDGVYDDPFASQANIVRATLKHLRPGGTELELLGLWMGKDYRGAKALELDGVELPSGALREDEVWRAAASLSVTLLRKTTGPLGLSLEADYWFTDHRSNDLFYNYRSHSAGVGVRVSY